MKYLSYVCCALWIAFIFYNSSFSAEKSNEISFGIVENISGSHGADSSDVNIEGVVDQPPVKDSLLTMEQLNLLIRKSAHFFQYFVLAILVFWILSQYEFNHRELSLYPLFVVLFVATLDEFFQLYTGRSSQVVDVLIDFGGGVCAFTVMLVMRRVFNK